MNEILEQHKRWLEHKEATLIQRYNQLCDDGASHEIIEVVREEIAEVQMMLMSAS